jgi:hypothetical protein
VSFHHSDCLTLKYFFNNQTKNVTNNFNIKESLEPIEHIFNCIDDMLHLAHDHKGEFDPLGI